MGASIQQETNGIWLLRFTGTLRKSELDTAQAAAIKELGTTGMAKILVIAEGFLGWERGADWGDLSFFIEHGDQIEKIAIVADPRWEATLLTFAAAGFRKAPVKFFPTSKLDDARAWLG